MKRCGGLIFVLLVTAVWAGAQGASGTPPAAGGNPGAGAPAAANPAPPAAEKPGSKPAPAAPGPADKESATADSAPSVDLAPKGDVITLKNGKKIFGQIVRRTPTGVEVEVTAGVTLKLIQKQIQDIKEDAVGPSGTRSGTAAAGDAKKSVIPGEKLSPELDAKLHQALANPPVKYVNKDLVAALTELAQRTGVNVVVDDAVKQLPEAERVWTVQATPEATLMTLLEDQFRKQFAQLEVVYQYDKILVMTKELAKALAPQEAKTAEPAPAPPPGPGPTPAPASPPPGPGPAPTPAPPPGNR